MQIETKYSTSQEEMLWYLRSKFKQPIVEMEELISRTSPITISVCYNPIHEEGVISYKYRCLRKCYRDFEALEIAFKGSDLC